VVALSSVFGLAQAQAQENLDRGRSAVQIYASNCAECHRNPKAVGKTMSSSALAGYLRVHYTASRESADTLAAYLSSLPADPRAGPARPSSGSKPAAKPRQAGPAKPGEPSTTPAAPAAPETPPPAAPAAEPAAKPAAGETKPPGEGN
jgi:hypothetical protein